MNQNFVLFLVVMGLSSNQCGGESPAGVPEPALVREVRTMLWSPTELVALREEFVARSNPDVMTAVDTILRFAKERLSEDSYTVTRQTIVPPSGDLHDYLSIGWYWWPCNSNPCGKVLPACGSDGLPWVSCDGFINPVVSEQTAKSQFVKMCIEVQAQALSYWYTGAPEHAERAAHLLRVFFLDPETRMNPNLAHGQGVPGKYPGREQGIIDVHGLPQLLDAVALLEGFAAWEQTEDQAALMSWFGEFLRWLEESELGVKARKLTNNHGTFYLQTALGLSLHVGDYLLARELADEAKARIELQIAADGTLPEELAREDGRRYTVFTLIGFARLTRMTRSHLEIDLLAQTQAGGTNRLQTALTWLRDHVNDRKPWPTKSKPGFNWAFADEVLRIAARTLVDPAFEVSGITIDRKTYETLDNVYSALGHTDTLPLNAIYAGPHASLGAAD